MNHGHGHLLRACATQATKALAALCARMNAEELEETGVYYALSVGVNPLGGPSTPGVLAKMEAQLLYQPKTISGT